MRKRATESYCIIATKPLQIIIANILCKQLPLNSEKDIIIIDDFKESFEIYQTIKNAPGNFSSVTYNKSRSAAYKTGTARPYNNILIDTDVGIKKLAQLTLGKLLNPQLNICVYEEGIGTYRTNLYHKHKSKLVQLIGAGSHFGGCILTQQIFVLDSTRYKATFPKARCRVTSITTSIATELSDNLDYYSNIFSFGATKSLISSQNPKDQCTIYLSSWEIDSRVIDRIVNLPGFKMIKPHPHIKNLKEVPTDEIATINGRIPAELILIFASEYFSSVHIIHHGSSAIHYIKSNNLTHEQV